MTEDKSVLEKEVLEPTTEASDAVEQKTDAKPKRKKTKKTVSRGQVHILASFNNTIVTVTDEKGNVISASSAGSCGFRGSKKGTAYAAQVAAEKALSEAKTMGLSLVDVFVQGIGLGRESAIRTLITQQISVESIKDETKIPHGGVRPRRAKRN